MANSPLATNTTIHGYVRYNARTEILSCVGDLSDMELFGTQLIVAPYVHSGLMWSDKLGFPREERLSLPRLYELYDSSVGFVIREHSVESIYTGKVLLVVKIGSEADKLGLRIGDWVVTLQENTRQVSITSLSAEKSRVLEFVGVKYAAGWPCKFLYESDVYARISDPDMVV